MPQVIAEPPSSTDPTLVSPFTVTLVVPTVTEVAPEQVLPLTGVNSVMLRENGPDLVGENESTARVTFPVAVAEKRIVSLAPEPPSSASRPVQLVVTTVAVQVLSINE